MYSFEWDEYKNMINKRKHGIGFEEAVTVFWDDQAVLIPDPEHSWGEERFLILGRSKTENVLVVVHCYRDTETVIRIISARKAVKKERQQYEDQFGR